MIWYDHFLAKGGAEQVSLLLARHLNDKVQTAWADPVLFSSFSDRDQIKSNHHDFQQAMFPTWSLIQFYLTQKPSSESSYWLLTGAFAPLMMINKPKNKIGVIYFHTFPSFVNDSFKGLSKRHGILKAFVFRGMCEYYKFWLKKAVTNSTRVLVNSHSVGERLKKYLGIHSQVLYPPVELEGLESKPAKEYYLSSARLEPNKQVEFILAAFKKRPSHKLIVAGGGALYNEFITKYADCENIQFLGWQTQAQMKTLYNYCKALIYLPKNEYFGIAPVEAMAAGKPVIGVAEGGLLETVTDPRCGYLLEPGFTTDDLCHIIDTFSFNDKDSKFRREHAEQFNATLFCKSLKKMLTISEQP